MQDFKIQPRFQLHNYFELSWKMAYLNEYYNVVYLAIFLFLISQGVIGPPGPPIIIDSGGLMGPPGNMASYHN